MLNKKLVLCAVLASGMGIATSAFANDAGLYVGGQVGYGYPQYNNVNSVNINNVSTALSPVALSSSLTKKNRDGGLAGRIFAGYQFNPTWGTELGFTQFSNAINKQTYSGNFVGGVNYSATDKTTVNTNAIDLVLTGTAPIEDGFSIVGKAGLAYVNAKSTQSGYTGAVVSGVTVPGVASTTTREHKVLPTASIGVKYDVTPQLAADLTYTRIQKVGHTNLIQSTNFVGVGLSYHFG